MSPPNTMKAFFFVALLSLLPFEANATAVYSQPHDLSSTLVQSSGNGNDYDMFVWDNFTLSSDQDIAEIDWRGGYVIDPVYPSGPVQYFDLSIWGTVANQPNIKAGPLALYEMVAGNETPAGTFGGKTMYDYSFALPTAFHAVAGTQYWVEIAAFQSGVPGWGLAAGSGGDAQHFSSFVNYAGGTQYRFASGDVAFTLLASGGNLPTNTPTQTRTATPTNTPTPTPTRTSIPCVGDCNTNRHVTVDELVTGASIGLGNALLDVCPAFDCNGNGQVTVDCLVQGVYPALNGCPTAVVVNEPHLGVAVPGSFTLDQQNVQDFFGRGIVACREPRGMRKLSAMKVERTWR